MVGPESAPRPEIRKDKAPDEIERKFLVAWLPENLNSYPHQPIKQGYPVIGADGSEARLRDRGGEYKIAFKGTGTLSRKECQVPISQDQFDALWPATGDRHVEKTRFTIPHDNDLAIELDIYEGKDMGHLSVEVEFPDEAAAQSFVPPEWFGEEVTDNPAYKNQNIAIHGVPPYPAY